MDLNFVSVHILKVQKKNKAITAILTEQGWLIKDLLYLQKYLFRESSFSMTRVGMKILKL